MMLHLIIGGSAIAYIFLASMTFALCPVDWKPAWTNHLADDGRFWAALFWPAFLVGVFFYFLATSGPRIVAWARRPKLPQARVVKD